MNECTPASSYGERFDGFGSGSAPAVLAGTKAPGNGHREAGTQGAGYIF
jgi:hypothetical protein